MIYHVSYDVFGFVYDILGDYRVYGVTSWTTRSSWKDLCDTIYVFMLVSFGFVQDIWYIWTDGKTLL